MTRKAIFDLTTKPSLIENNIKEARISTLQKIVELGFGGHLELSIKLKTVLRFEIQIAAGMSY